MVLLVREGMVATASAFAKQASTGMTVRLAPQGMGLRDEDAAGVEDAAVTGCHDSASLGSGVGPAKGPIQDPGLNHDGVLCSPPDHAGGDLFAGLTI